MGKAQQSLDYDKFIKKGRARFAYSIVSKYTKRYNEPITRILLFLRVKNMVILGDCCP